MGIAFGTLQALVFRVLGTFFLMLVGVVTARALSVEDLGIFVTTTVVIAIAGSLAASFSSAAGYFVSNRGVPAALVASNSLVLSLAIGLVALLAEPGSLLRHRWRKRSRRPPRWRHAVPAHRSLRHQRRISRPGAHRALQLRPPRPRLPCLRVPHRLGHLLDHRTVEDALGAWIAAQYAALFVSCLFVPTWWKRLLDRPDLTLIWSFVTFGTVTGLAGVISYLNYRVDQLLVRAFDGAEGAGTYAPAVVLAESIWLFSTAISVASYSRVGSLTRPEAAELTVRAVRHTWMTAFAAMVGVFVFANLVIVLLYGDKYEGAANSLRILALGTALYAPQAVISNYFTVSLGRPSISLGLASCSLVTGAIFGVLLIPPLGYVGGAWATMLSYAVTATISTGIFLRMSGTNPLELFHYRRSDLVAYLDLGREIRARISAAHLAGARPRP
jgi:O-antigen/teichoic acid export membrane protein